MRKILVVIDDDDLVAAGLRLITPKDWSIQELSYLDLANPILSKAQILLCDMHLTQTASTIPLGLSIIEKCKLRFPHLEIAAMSGDLNMNLMEQGIKAGAQYFLPKPIIKEELWHILTRTSNYLDLIARQSEAKFSHKWIGSGTTSSGLLKLISRIQDSPGHILIEGESGTGKEVIAHLIAKQTPQTPFLSLNVSAIPSNLFESELFGHTKGAFTGADAHRPGLVEATQNGILFLDEIEALDIHNQAKLLRFLESGEARRIGSKDVYHSNARVIAASNIPIDLLVEQQKFRADLMFRLNQNKIEVPALRDRFEDLEELAVYFLEGLRPKVNKHLLPESLELLKKYSFPGNVRELKRILEQAAYQAPLPFIRPADLSHLFLKISSQPDSCDIEAQTYDSDLSLDQNLEKVEKAFISAFLKRHQDLEQVWQALKISRSSLYKKIKHYGITVS